MVAFAAFGSIFSIFFDVSSRRGINHALFSPDSHRNYLMEPKAASSAVKYYIVVYNGLLLKHRIGGVLVLTGPKSIAVDVGVAANQFRWFTFAAVVGAMRNERQAALKALQVIQSLVGALGQPPRDSVHVQGLHDLNDDLRLTLESEDFGVLHQNAMTSAIEGDRSREAYLSSGELFWSDVTGEAERLCRRLDDILAQLFGSDGGLRAGYVLGRHIDKALRPDPSADLFLEEEPAILNNADSSRTIDIDTVSHLQAAGPKLCFTLPAEGNCAPDPSWRQAFDLLVAGSELHEHAGRVKNAVGENRVEAVHALVKKLKARLTSQDDGSVESEAPKSKGRRRKAVPRAEAEVLVMNYLTDHASDPQGIRRDDVAKATGVSAGGVCNTRAWDIFKENRPARRSTTSVRAVRLSPEMFASVAEAPEDRTVGRGRVQRRNRRDDD